MTRARVSMIVAMSENRVIARNGQMPWHLPADLKFFKATTMGHTIIMGRKTADTLEKPLPGRTNVIVTRDKTFGREGFRVSHDVHQAVQHAIETGDVEPFIVGGGEMYKLALPAVARLYITRVHTIVEDGDTFFPELDEQEWKRTATEAHQADDRHAFAFTFETWERQHATVQD